MRRFVFGLLWFVAFSYGLSIGGAFVATQLSGDSPPQEAREDFSRRFGPFIFFGSIALAAAGTITGRLPGTAPGNKSDRNQDSA